MKCRLGELAEFFVSREHEYNTDRDRALAYLFLEWEPRAPENHDVKLSLRRWCGIYTWYFDEWNVKGANYYFIPQTLH